METKIAMGKQLLLSFICLSLFTVSSSAQDQSATTKTTDHRFGFRAEAHDLDAIMLGFDYKYKRHNFYAGVNLLPFNTLIASPLVGGYASYRYYIYEGKRFSHYGVLSGGFMKYTEKIEFMHYTEMPTEPIVPAIQNSTFKNYSIGLGYGVDYAITRNFYLSASINGRYEDYSRETITIFTQPASASPPADRYRTGTDVDLVLNLGVGFRL